MQEMLCWKSPTSQVIVDWFFILARVLRLEAENKLEFHKMDCLGRYVDDQSATAQVGAPPIP